ncbi:MAG: plasmid pRiA4b ORF-3 family protein [Actinomycetota bacterium]|nr:plasmid pRiA4b ORF-3 family protein [Actinomycetota bacterium]
MELLHGGARVFDPPPGRDILVSPQHTFRHLADAINTAFARWDLSHLYAFTMADDTRIEIEPEDESDRPASRTKLGRREQGEVFAYEFDFGDSWEHRCTVIETGIDPEETYGDRPKSPVPVWGWGDLPDQYGRRDPDG